MAKVLIVGAGAAGLMAAGAAVRQGHQVTVLEHMDKPAQKILVTGKGRCNVTNDCTAEEFLHTSLNVSETSRNLYMHRNTLMYRLDKIERATGLDIRKFQDAMTFRLVMILYKLIV
mgnify:CR=1 FL=1